MDSPAFNNTFSTCDITDCLPRLLICDLIVENIVKYEDFERVSLPLICF
jgi:hypothetical protein